MKVDLLEPFCPTSEWVIPAAIGTGVEHQVVVFESRGHVVGIEDHHLGHLAEPITTYHADVHPWDCEDAGQAPWCSCDQTSASQLTGNGVEQVIQEEWHQVLTNTDWPDAQATAMHRWVRIVHSSGDVDDLDVVVAKKSGGIADNGPPFETMDIPGEHLLGFEFDLVLDVVADEDPEVLEQVVEQGDVTVVAADVADGVAVDGGGRPIISRR